ncbi:GAF domain-containing protein [Streptomyces sp. NPDC058086]|uniref:GAF domain-containing protein n=1 Tax=Streptomyces sp. NPDC058086 TaxID=3346334 RepID=UPI0036F03E41
MYPLRRLADLRHVPLPRSGPGLGQRGPSVGSGAQRSHLRHGPQPVHGAGLDARTPAAEAVRGRPLFISDGRSTAADPDWPDGGSQAEVYLPLIGSRKVVGACCLSFPGSPGFPPEERAVLSMMAELLGAAMERVELSTKQHAVAAYLQRRLLPLRSPNCPG